jgi:hypothetical protein
MCGWLLLCRDPYAAFMSFCPRTHRSMPTCLNIVVKKPHQGKEKEVGRLLPWTHTLLSMSSPHARAPRRQTAPRELSPAELLLLLVMYHLVIRS